jgi:16S rRNA (guanine966-N2)-methyltransferase
MPRIVAGRARGRRLVAPAGDATRPTADRAREALFSSLESLVGPWHGLRMVDLYAGSGAVGLEAWSRGAASVVLVERDRRALAALRANVETVLSGASASDRRAHEVTVAAVAVESFAAAPGPAHDVVFADPPYALADDDLAAVLLALDAAGGIAEGGVVVVERSTRSATWRWPAGFEALRERSYGEGTLWYGRRAAGAPGSGVDPEGGADRA